MVETKTAKQKAAGKKKAPTQPTPAAAVAPTPEVATGPVRDYVAARSTTGTKTDTPIVEIPQSISVVGTEQVRDQGAQNLGEALRYTPGVVADGFGFDSRGDYSIVRGIPAAYFLNGMRTTYGYYANTAGAEPYSLERIEVLRGPSSMLFGQSTSGGIINMVSKLPKATPHGEVTFDVGSYNFRQAKVDFGGPATPDGKWLYRVVGVARDADTQVDHVPNDRLFIAPSLTFKPSSATSITLLGTILDDKGGSVQQFLPHAGTLYPNALGQRVPLSRFIGEPTDFNNTRQQSATLLVDHKFSDALSLHHGARYTHTENTYNTHYTAPLTSTLLGLINAGVGFPIFNPATAPFLDANQQQIARVFLSRRTETDVFTTDTNMTGKFFTGAMAHKLTVGFDYTRYGTGGEGTPILVDNLAPLGQSAFNIYNPTYGKNAFYYAFPSFAVVPSNNVPLIARPNETQTQAGVYVQDQIKLGAWTAVVGLRKDWLNIAQTGQADDDIAEVTGRAGLMYHFKSGLTPYVSYSQAFASQPGNLVVDNPLNPTSPRAAAPLKGDQIEAGFKYQPPGAPFLLSAAVYELTEQNRLVSDVLSGFAQQGAEARIRGFEIEAIGKLSENLKVIGAYAYTDATYAAHFDAFEVGTPVEGVPRHLASLWGIYSLLDGPLRGWSLGAGVRYTGASEDFGRLVDGTLGTVKTPSFTLYDAMLSYDAKQWRWQLVGQNLADTYHVVTCTARGDCGVGQGRTIISSLTYRF